MKKINTMGHYDDRMSFKEKLVLSSGGIVSCIDMLMVQSFLLYYYTDVLKISAAFAGTLFLVTRIIAAIAAPIFGIFVDRTTTPWGKYRPYYIIMGIPTAIFGFLTFTSFNFDDSGKYIYATITYLFYNLFTSIGGVPKAAMGPTMTKNINDRVTLGLMGYIFAVFGSVLATTGAPILVQVFGGNNEAKGFSTTMAVFGALAVVIAFTQYFFLREKYSDVKRQDEPKHTMRELLVAAFHNRTAIIVLILTLSMSLATGVRTAVTMHYLKYYLHRPDLMAQMGLYSMVSLFAGALLSPILTKKIGVRRNVMFCTIITIITFALFYIIPGQNGGIIFYIVLTMINGFFNGLYSPAQSTLMPNAIDYCEWKTGIKAGAFMSSINSFINTVGTAFAGVIVGMMLTFTGYQADMEQSQMSIAGLKLMMSIIPAVVSILAMAVIWLGDTEKQHEVVVKELMDRRIKESEKNNS